MTAVSNKAASVVAAFINAIPVVVERPTRRLVRNLRTGHYYLYLLRNRPIAVPLSVCAN